ncbi:hypothetical protein [Nonomuraea endophytica]|uniref:hypothetical protein n=1 Tax=Nonomuraea endophytica TaxID=714136 RepID=UPI0037CA22D9
MPVNADAPDVIVETIEVINPLGVKGIREIGMAAAIANAVYHATGKRPRSFTIESLL